MSGVVWGRPMGLPLALAFSTPDLTLARIIESSNSANTLEICRKAFVMRSNSPLVQPTVRLPKITSFSHFSLTVSIISHNCFVLLARQLTSIVTIVSPAAACTKRTAPFQETSQYASNPRQDLPGVFPTLKGRSGCKRCGAGRGSFHTAAPQRRQKQRGRKMLIRFSLKVFAFFQCKGLTKSILF